MLIAALFGCPKPTVVPATDTPEYAAVVVAAKDGWEVELRFRDPQTAVLFDTSHGPWRTSWEALGGGRIEAHHGLDLLVLDPPGTSARFRVAMDADASGTPPLVRFSDGSTAFYTGQLALLTVESREAAIALQGDLRGWTGTQPPVEVEVRGAAIIGPDGAAQTVRAVAHQGTGPYVYSGGLRPEAGRLADPGLPDPVAQAFSDDSPGVRRHLESRWGAPIPEPSLWLAWGGPEGDLRNVGRAEGRQIVMSVQGAPYLDPEPDLDPLVWFFAHELTHHHQRLGGVRWPTWMAEGFADLGATEALFALGRYERSDLERRYWSVSRECARLLTGRTLASSRGRVAYVCGDVAGLAVQGLLPDRDLPALWAVLAEDPDQDVTTDDLVAALVARGADPDGAEAVRTFVEGRHEDTDAAIQAVLEAAGREPHYVEGSLSSLAFPFGR
ncbi:MAG: hypothetical protein H6736_13680 [Alphaproteobacteria bacterium]|nr:hypothetical protein [Alphaproteobacteria bacterium]MCB9692856.1 hypothetical protein [Alphaproteobacteria bacterium]